MDKDVFQSLVELQVQPGSPRLPQVYNKEPVKCSPQGFGLSLGSTLSRGATACEVLRQKTGEISDSPETACERSFRCTVQRSMVENTFRLMGLSK